METEAKEMAITVMVITMVMVAQRYDTPSLRLLVSVPTPETMLAQPPSLLSPLLAVLSSITPAAKI